MNFSVYWQHADAVSKTLYFVLLAMSITTWTIFVLRLMGTRQLEATSLCSTFSSVKQIKGKIFTFKFRTTQSSGRTSFIASNFC